MYIYFLTGPRPLASVPYPLVFSLSSPAALCFPPRSPSPCSPCVSPSSPPSSLSVLPCGSPLARSVPVLLVSPLSPCLLSLSSPAALLSPRSLGPCAPCVWIWVWSCLFFWFSRRFLENQKNLRENQKYKRKPKKH